MRVLGLVLAALSVASIAAAEEPTGFSDITWGTSYGVVLGICADPDAGKLGDFISCKTKIVDLDGVRMYPQLSFDDASGLAAYTIHAPNYAYRTLRNAAVAKFGEPARRTVKSYTTKRGQPIDGEQLVWEWSSGVGAVLNQVCGRIDTGCLHVSTKSYGEKLRRLQRESTERAKRGF